MNSAGENQIIVRPADAPSSIALVAPALSPEELLIEQWLFGRPATTARMYASDWRRLQKFVGVPLHEITLSDLQSFAASLQKRESKLKPGSVHKILAGVKSLFAFATRVKYLPFDVSTPLRLSGVKNKLNERILPESDVIRLIMAAKPGRDRMIVELLYVAALRRSELCGLRRGDAIEREDLRAEGYGGQLTIFGKGSKTGIVLIPRDTWLAMKEYVSIASDADRQRPIFESRDGKAICPSQVYRIIKAAAKKAGISLNTSPHFLRHCHATHALQRGADLKTIQQTLRHSKMETTAEYLHARPRVSSSGFLASIPRGEQ